MSTSTALRPAVRAAFTALIDYAGLYPPAELPMAQAAAEYRSERAGPYGWMLGRFIIPDRALRTLPPELTGPFSVIVQRDVDALRSVAGRRRQGVRVEALEMALGDIDASFRKDVTAEELDVAIGLVYSDIAMAGALDDLPVYLEIPRSKRWNEQLAPTMTALHRSGFGAKIRCGGLTPEAFPSVHDVAAFIAAAGKQNVPFKATAGLHHPVRHVDSATGFTMHGFLNLLAATALAAHVDPETLACVIAEEDPSAFAFDDEFFSWRGERVATAALESMRREGFIAYGSCSFEEPVDDLIGLGILPPR